MKPNFPLVFFFFLFIVFGMVSVNNAQYFPVLALCIPGAPYLNLKKLDVSVAFQENGVVNVYELSNAWHRRKHTPQPQYHNCLAHSILQFCTTIYGRAMLRRSTGPEQKWSFDLSIL